MVSSVYADLVQHRRVLMAAIEGMGLHPVAMEQDSARPVVTVIESSLEKVRDAAAYVCVIGFLYGSVPDSAEHNPQRLSLTELEFREAIRLKRPTLLFIMGPDHDVRPHTVVEDAERRAKLDAFREFAKRSSADSPVQRVYKEFNSLGEFEVAATRALAELRELLNAPAPALGDDDIPAPPALYAEPPYLGSHDFVGRTVQIRRLNDWAAPAGPNPVLLYEAIGGTGKSLLTWEWTTRHAHTIRSDWAGRFWYSFYERGAVMTDFCRRALAYMTGRPLDAFKERRQPELTEMLLRQLRARPWLLVLDGLERVLVAYHRFDAAQLADEEAGTSDEIARRHPHSAIRPADEDLLRYFAAAGPSRILITSRLLPRALLNPASQPIPGVLHERLPGLRPAEAEALLRACGARGNSAQMRDFLRRHCDCHPLVTGVVAGLVNDYLPARGDFDAWAADPEQGGRLNLADLDLVQKRNHILVAAVEALPQRSRQLLALVSLLPGALNWTTLSALDPHRPAEPEFVAEPPRPWWDGVAVPEGSEGMAEARRDYAAELQRWQEYELDYAAWQRAPQTVAATNALIASVRDLEQRGLLQYDRQAGRWDLHPVVRAVASGGLASRERDQLGQRIVDYFAQRLDPYTRAETLDDLQHGITLVRTLLHLGRTAAAWEALRGDLVHALLVNVEAPAELLFLVRPLFTGDWSAPADKLDNDDIGPLVSCAAWALSDLGHHDQSMSLYRLAARHSLASNDWRELPVHVSNLGVRSVEMNKLIAGERWSVLGLRLAEQLRRHHPNADHVFRALLLRFRMLAVTGRRRAADEHWYRLDAMERPRSRNLYRPGEAEYAHLALLRFPQGNLTEGELAAAERLADEGLSRRVVRLLRRLRGEWHLSCGQPALAAENLQDAIRMAHEAGAADHIAEAWHVLAQLQMGQHANAHEAATRLSAAADVPHLPLTEVWMTLGDTTRAVHHAAAAYRSAWADGEPYVRRHDLARATALLNRLNVETPNLPPYDPARHPIDLWEREIAETVAKRIH